MMKRTNTLLIAAVVLLALAAYISYLQSELQQLRKQNNEMFTEKRVISDRLQAIFERVDSLNTIQSQNPDIKRQYEEKKPLVLSLTVMAPDLNIREGTCFAYSPGGLFMTNHHVLNSSDLRAYIRDVHGNKAEVIEILAEDEELDYCLFIADLETPETLRGTDDGITVGDRVFAISNPKGLKHSLSEGIISSIRENGTIIQTTAPITSGSSGGPLLNHKGELIGLLFGGMRGNESFNFAVNIKYIQQEMRARFTAASGDEEPVRLKGDHLTQLVLRNRLDLLTDPQLKEFYHDFPERYVFYPMEMVMDEMKSEGSVKNNLHHFAKTITGPDDEEYSRIEFLEKYGFLFNINMEYVTRKTFSVGPGVYNIVYTYYDGEDLFMLFYEMNNMLEFSRVHVKSWDNIKEWLEETNEG
jgi:S1-C subfamily serine protease